MTSTIRAFHNDLTLKAEAVARMRAHAEADAIIQGIYIRPNPDAPGGYEGCFYGCLVAEMITGDDLSIKELCKDDYFSWHATAEQLLGLCERYGRLTERIFEGMPPSEKSAFAVAILEAIPVGADLDRVVDEMIIQVMSDPEHGVRQFAQPDGQAAIDQVVELYRRQLAGDAPSDSDWAAVESAAGSAAAWAAAWAARTAWAVGFAARAAEHAATESAARSTRQWQAETLIELTAAALNQEVTA